jgi:hypothetical protein
METLAAIGLASNILSFVDYSLKVFSAAIEIHRSPHGDTEDAHSRMVAVNELKKFAAKLQQPEDSANGPDASLCMLARECENICKQMIVLLDKFKPKDQSRISSFRAGFKSIWYERELKKVEERLIKCRDQLDLQFKQNLG